MDVQELLGKAHDAANVKRVFGTPVAKDGLTIIPVASVMGGGGGGEGREAEGAGGAGTGFGYTAHPVGAYVIKDGEVSWHPAFDLNRAILGGQIAAIFLFLTVRAAVKARGKTKRTKIRRRD